MFQFRRFPTYGYVFTIRYWSIAPVGFPIRKSTDRSSCAAPRSLSQLITSFVGSWCQGIPLAPYIAWPLYIKLLSGSQNYASSIRNYFWLIVITLKFILTVASYIFSSKSSMFSFQGPIELLFLFSQFDLLIRISVSRDSNQQIIALGFFRSGGPKWTRTTDLTIISRAL